MNTNKLILCNLVSLEKKKRKEREKKSYVEASRLYYEE